jgi:co-chaperonin GroES (HSP10)
MVNDSGLTPLEFFVLVELDPQEKKTAGGIILTENTQERDELAVQEGTLVAISPHAFSYAEDWPEGSKPEVGQRVLFKRYAGTSGGIHRKTVNGVERRWRLMNDKELIAIIESEPTLAAAA